MKEEFDKIIEQGMAMIMQKRTGESLQGGEELRVIN